MNFGFGEIGVFVLTEVDDHFTLHFTSNIFLYNTHKKKTKEFRTMIQRNIFVCTQWKNNGNLKKITVQNIIYFNFEPPFL